MLHSIDSRPKVIAVTETRLNSNSISNVDLPNYNFFHADSPTLAGGTAIYTNTKAYATLVTEHILLCLCIVIFLFSFIDVISVNTANVITFVNSAKTIKI